MAWRQVLQITTPVSSPIMPYEQALHEESSMQDAATCLAMVAGAPSSHVSAAFCCIVLSICVSCNSLHSYGGPPVYCRSAMQLTVTARWHGLSL
jgi:hypothetical protein